MTTAKLMRILLVEDDEGHATLIRMNIEDAGLSNPIIHVTDGQAALDYVWQATGAHDLASLLILLDLNLPAVDGFGVLEQLKSDERTQKIPVIVLTSTNNPQEIDRCYTLGCNVFLRKPVAYDQFIHAIKQLGMFLSVIELPPNPNENSNPNF